MKKSDILILFRKDLFEHLKIKNIENINIYDFKVHQFNLIKTKHIVLFIDNNGNVNILKNRYGKQGIIK